MGGGDDELERWELLHGAAAAAAAWAAQQQRLPPPRLQGLTEKSVECWVLKFSVVTLGMGNPRPSFGKKSELVVCVVQRRSFFLVTLFLLATLQASTNAPTECRGAAQQRQWGSEEAVYNDTSPPLFRKPHT